jgi:hypothetical protein
MPTNPKTIVWEDPTQNTDNTPIVPGEITGFNIGIRKSTDPVGTYPTNVLIKDPTVTSEAFSLLGVTLTPGDYFAAIQALSTTNGNSAFSAEAAFTIVSTAPPQAPTGFTIS